MVWILFEAYLHFGQLCNFDFYKSYLFMIKRFAKLPKINKDFKEPFSYGDQFAHLQRSIELLSNCFSNFTSSFRSIIAKKMDSQSKNHPSQLAEDSSSSFRSKDKIFEQQQEALPSSPFKNAEQSNGKKQIQNILQQGKQQQLQKEIEPRFKEVNVPVPIIDNTKISQQFDKYLIDWLGTVCKMVFSAGFNLFQKGVLSESKTKSFCSENFIRNILRFCERYEMHPKHFSLINKTLQKQILPYFLLKYPQSEEKQSSKKFSSVLIQKDDTTENDIDLVFKSGVKFKINQNGNYSSDIMLFFNWIMRLPNLQIDRGETLYENFQKDVGSLFKMVENEKSMMDMLKFDPKNPKMAKQVELETLKKQQVAKELKQNYENEVQKNHLQQKAEFQYRQKVKSYTHYLIGSKLSTNLDIFSDFDIKSASLKFKNSALMRVATKFCEQLQKCYDFNQISNRQSLFRMKDGSEKFLNNEDKMMLNMFLRFEKKLIDKKLENILKNNSEHQSFFAKNCRESSLSKFCDGEAIVGKFTSIIYKLGESYLLYYLNLLLHGINRAASNYGSVKDFRNSTESKEKNQHKLTKMFEDNIEKQVGEQWLNQVCKEINIQQRTPENATEQTPELINFKIGDLMRCKCVSKQNQILAIYKQVERISHLKPSLFKIIRVKNRLNQGNKDILMNLVYKQKMIVQMQLTIKSEKSNFIECSNKFNHYLYELKRAKFGPLTQMCCIWVNQDLRSPFYLQRIKQIMSLKKVFEKEKKPCCQLFENQQLRDLPFQCSQCQSFYDTCSTTQKHTLCTQCKQITCFWCKMKYKQEKQELVSELIESNPGIQLQSAEFLETVPSNGGVLVNLKSNSKDVSSFNTIQHNGYYYLFQTLKSEPKDYQIPRLNLLYKFKNKKNKFQQDFSKDILVMSSEKITNNMIKLSKHQANLFVFIPEYLAKRYEIRGKSVFLNEKKVKDKYFSELLKSYPQFIGKVWSSVQRLNLASNWLQTVEEIIPQMFPNIEYLMLNQNSLLRLGCERTISHWQNLKYLNIRNNMISETEEIVNNFPKLTFLDLTGNQIKKLCSNFVQLNMNCNLLTELGNQFGGLANLEILNVKLNSIKIISREFCQLKKLRVLELEENNLKQIPEDLQYLTGLRSLGINKNYIPQMPEIFDKFKNLQKLQIQKTHLKRLPTTITKLEKLQILKINATLTEKISEDIGNLSNLRQFQADYCQFTQIPANLTKLTNLTKLNLIQAKILTLPQNLGNLINLSAIDLRQSKIKSLPKSIKQLKNLTKISLYACKSIKRLPESFGMLKSLSELILTLSNIGGLPQSFGNLKHLTKLYLASCPISALPDNFGNLISLVELNMAETRILSLPESFGNLKSLSVLNLEKCKIQSLPQSFGKIRTLTQLNLLQSRLKTLPASFGGLRILNRLNLSKSSLQNLPQSFGNLTSLTQLSICDTKLKQLPESFGSLKKVEKLDLISCKIASLPDSFGNMQSLHHLDLSNTSLKMLPQSFGKLKSLKRLLLTYSQIQELPESFGQLKYIYYIDINHTPIKKLPSSFGQLQCLIKIFLQKTQITELPESFGNLTSLNELVLIQTPLTSLPVNFGGLKSLRILNLIHSRIQMLPQSFGKLISLANLRLQHSWIKHLCESFGQLLNLQFLDLSESKILRLPQSIGNLKKLDRLNLRKSAIQQLPQSLGNIKSLSDIDLTSTTNLISLPESLTQLQNLKQFRISGSGIKNLPNSIGNLSTKITKLDLSNTCLKQLPLSFGSLKTLHTLVIKNTPIESLPSNFGQLNSLAILQIRQTNIKQLPQSFGNLEQLYNFTLVQNQQLSCLPQNFGELKTLYCFRVSNKLIARLPQSMGKLQNLQILQIYRTGITELPQSMGDLLKLRQLQISESPLQNLPSSICNLASLRNLNLNKTALQYLPQNFGNLKNLYDFKLNDTKIKKLPESISQLSTLVSIQLLNNHHLQTNCLVPLAKLPCISQIKMFIGGMKLEQFPVEQLSQVFASRTIKIWLESTVQIESEKIKRICQQKKLPINIQLITSQIST